MHLALLHAIQVRRRPHVPRLLHTCCCRLDAAAAVAIAVEGESWAMHAMMCGG